MAINTGLLQVRLGSDITLRKSDKGTSYAYVNAACSVWNGTENQTHWFSFQVVGKTAENAAKNLKKGSEVIFECQLTTEAIECSDGITRNFTKYFVRNMHFISVPKNHTSEATDTEVSYTPPVEEEKPF